MTASGLPALSRSAAAAVPRRGPAAVRRATLIGAIAVLLWSTNAILTVLTGAVPPFQLVAMAFTVAFGIGLVWPALQGRSMRSALRQRPAVWALGIAGLFGWHSLYFLALRQAPPVEANLINYLWPLFIVLGSALLPGERLRSWHVAGAAMGLAGAVLLILPSGAGGGAGVSIAAEHAVGYGAALGAAVVWAAYSVLSRRFGQVPTDAVGGFCGATAVLALVCHLAFEATVWPEGLGWLAVLAMGLGPVGLAFFVWDHGVKRGDIRALGAFSYAAPLLSTLLLIACGRGEPSVTVAAAGALIVGGAVLAARDLFIRSGGARPSD